ncbi:hypothetical protein M3C89_004715 [Micrococcus luteus]|nr:hypothetical protein [Micrococcus luteus]MCV7720800.1 hypothetical protein [Micrococcus luteus]MCV7740512.1 hypothetical protein [Micrococcus luteus]
MKLMDFAQLSEQAVEGSYSRDRGLRQFLSHPVVVQLGWPDEVVEQWLFDHATCDPFHIDYGHIDLRHVDWALERLDKSLMLDVRTGASDAGAIEDWAECHEHAVRIRAASSSPAHRGIREKWDKEGTWLRPPLLIERALVGEGLAGLQLVEGRTRVGVLRGRHADGLHVADTHLAWVGRRRLMACE